MIKEISTVGWSSGKIWKFMKEVVGKVNDKPWEGRGQGEWLCTGATFLEGRTILNLEFEPILGSRVKHYDSFSVEKLV